MWSHVPDENRQSVAKSLHDYRMIRKTINGTTKHNTIEVTNNWHKEEVNWLKTELAKARSAGERVLVMAHHAPWVNGTYDPQFDGSPNNCAFATDLPQLIQPPSCCLDLWSYGTSTSFVMIVLTKITQQHSSVLQHYSSSHVINNITVVSNQLGYVMFNENSGYQPNFTITCK